MTLQEIASFLDGKLDGPEDLEIKRPAKIEQAEKGDITFISNPRYAKYLPETKASAVIIDQNIGDVGIPSIRVKNAYIGFLQVLKLFMPEFHEYIDNVSGQACIDSSARIAGSARIAPMAYIGPGVEVGESTVIYPGVVLLRNVRIGQHCVLYPNVSIREECTIGDHVILHNGCVIGSDGFGFAPEGKEYQKIPQLGRVVIEDNVEIGANVTIDRATIGDTIIRSGCKIDNLVQIAHNVTVGKNTVMAAQSGIAGSTEIGRHVTIGGQVGITGHIKIADETIIAAQSGVTKDTIEKSVMFGTPALPIMQQKRIDVSLRKLPDLFKTVHSLEQKIEKLKAQIDNLGEQGADDKESADDKE